VIPPGVSYAFAGSYENQVRSERRLAVILPVALVAILLLLYLQFHRFATAFLVFSGIFIGWAGGFQMLWLYGQPWFLDFAVFGVEMRDLFQIAPVNLSVAVWVGFLALFGIASDDGVIMATYLTQVFRRDRPRTRAGIRAATVEAAERRVRPCLMTTGTTVLALLPVLTSTGRGADIMVPMAVPSFGGMTVVVLTLLVVPTAWSWLHERRL
jgi:Cu(I)/Ag(I) efflux system membrane protein CusA/SilA